MHYVLADDSVPFDGYTSARRPLGGAEKAFAQLAAALVTRGHQVTVLNQTPYPVTADGVRYKALQEIQERPIEADVVIAFRQPALLGTVRKARLRLLWVVAQPEYLTAPANASLWESFSPTLLFISEHQRRLYAGTLPSRVVAPGVGSAFYDRGPVLTSSPEYQAQTDPTVEVPKTPPHAIVTTHPLHGLVWITEIWRRLIHPQMNEARLAIYSTVLAKGNRGEAVPDNIQPVLDRVKMAMDANVVIVDPRGDPGMAEIYRSSRIHFYPGHAQDYACWTLIESQAAGTPAVARNIGGAEERIINGQTGYLVPDAAGAANVALQILRDDAVYQNLSTAAGGETRRRTLAMVAAEIDEIVAQATAAKN
jgi:hypothetical protein